ncbi:MAG: MBL fold metallo-hydrolase [Aestuariivirgaceae bacterium]|nr:MBL fold metallo-hydrolase [Aestuariivirgaceae bacterium]
MPKSSRNAYYQGPPSPHFDGERFRLPGHFSMKTLREVMRWRMNNPWTPWPQWLPVTQDEPPAFVEGSSLRVSFIGQATMLIQTQGMNILTDPFFSLRASPVQWAGPKRVRTPGVALEKLPKIDLILLSHNHYDHMDIPALKALHARHEPLILTPLGNGGILRKANSAFRVRELDLYTSHETRAMKVTLTPARHWSRRTARDTNHALWGAFVLETESGPIYFAGDTGYGDGAHFREVRERFGPPRLALLPIGAYEPRWFMKDQHMDPAEAVQAHLDLGATLSLAMHHATVQLTGEAIHAPARELEKARARHGLSEEDFPAPWPGSHIHLI